MVLHPEEVGLGLELGRLQLGVGGRLGEELDAGDALGAAVSSTWMWAHSVQITASPGRVSVARAITLAPVPFQTRNAVLSGPNRSRRRASASAVHRSAPYARAWPVFAATRASSTWGSAPAALSLAKARPGAGGIVAIRSCSIVIAAFCNTVR